MSGDFMSKDVCELSYKDFIINCYSFPFERFKPRRLCSGLPESFGNFWFYEDETGVWDSCIRAHPNRAPWDGEGWYIECLGDLETRPRSPVNYKPLYPGVYWAYLSRRGEWVEAEYDSGLDLFFCSGIVDTPDWFIPIPKFMFDASFMRSMSVVHEW